VDPTSLGLLAVVSLATSILSGIVGMAGGVVLLSVMLLFLAPLVALPLHGVVQLVSNGSRAWAQRRDVHWGIAARYSALLLPAGFVGLALLRSLPAAAAQAWIGAFVLVATWRPRWLWIGAHPERLAMGRRFVLLGGVVGLLNTTVGATGPLIAPFFLDLGLDRRQLVGTKAACQAIGHLAKLVVFGAGGFAFAGWLGPLALLCAASVAGTWIGTHVLERTSEESFVRLYKAVLTLVALRLVWAGAASLAQS
jgi:uncharacterized membrane protein YfcA